MNVRSHLASKIKGSQLEVKERIRMFIYSWAPKVTSCDGANEFGAEVVNHLCRWLRAAIKVGPSDHPREGPEKIRLLPGPEWLWRTPPASSPKRVNFAVTEMRACQLNVATTTAA